MVRNAVECLASRLLKTGSISAVINPRNQLVDMRKQFVLRYHHTSDTSGRPSRVLASAWQDGETLLQRWWQ